MFAKIYSQLLKFHPRAVSCLDVTFYPHRQTELCEIMTQCGSDKGAWHNYTTFYHPLLNGLRKQQVRVFELGLGTNNEDVRSNMGANGVPGASLRGWRKYFPKSSIFGADIDGRILFQEERIRTFQCDQTDPASIRALWANPDLPEDFDLIIEDGLHVFSANKTFFENSIQKLRPGGYFIIEDLDEAALDDYETQLFEWRRRYAHLSFGMVKIPSLIGISNMVMVAHRAPA